MKNINLEYGQEVNYLELKSDELVCLAKFLKPYGIELRSTMYSGKTDTYRIQARNPLLDNARWYPNQEAGELLEASNSEIAGGRWKR